MLGSSGHKFKLVPFLEHGNIQLFIIITTTSTTIIIIIIAVIIIIVIIIIIICSIQVPCPIFSLRFAVLLIIWCHMVWRQWDLFPLLISTLCAWNAALLHYVLRPLEW